MICVVSTARAGCNVGYWALLLLGPPLYTQAGTSNGGFWQSSHEEDFSRTPLGVNEYRTEIYHPPYEFRPNRPRITMRPPTFVPYGSTFDIGYAFDTPAAVEKVVLVSAGGVSAAAGEGIECC